MLYEVPSCIKDNIEKDKIFFINTHTLPVEFFVTKGSIDFFVVAVFFQFKLVHRKETQ